MYKNKKEIIEWLDSFNINNYHIHDDLTVSVNGNVELSNFKITELPIKFKIIYGNFDCSINNFKNFIGFPEEIKGYFNCSNNEITSLKGCPKISSDFYCYKNHLTNLKGCPKIINGDFSCYHNNITNLQYAPEIILGKFSCRKNYLTSLEYFPKEIKGTVICMDFNKFTENDLIHVNINLNTKTEIYSDFNKNGNKSDFIDKLNYIKTQNENNILKNINKKNIFKIRKKL